MREYSERYMFVWFFTHLIDLIILAESIRQLNICFFTVFLVALLILLLVYKSHSKELLCVCGRRIIYYYNCIKYHNKFSWVAESKKYRYVFEKKREVRNIKKLNIVCKTDHLQAIEDKFSFLKPVSKVDYDLRFSSGVSLGKEYDDNGYHYITIEFDKALLKNQAKEVSYTIDVRDPNHELHTIYGTTISQLTKLLDLTVRIPAELRPKNIEFVIYADNIERIPIYSRPLIYSIDNEEVHCVVQYPVLYRRYAIQWEW